MSRIEDLEESIGVGEIRNEDMGAGPDEAGSLGVIPSVSPQLVTGHADRERSPFARCAHFNRTVAKGDELVDVIVSDVTQDAVEHFTFGLTLQVADGAVNSILE